MRAMQYRAYGSPDQLAQAEVALPQPAPSQLLVRVIATSVNPIDWKLHNGDYRWIMPVKFPSIPGFDVAGEVVKTSAQTTQFKAGDRVFAMTETRPGRASAEYVAVGAAAAAHMPDNLSPAEAAAVPLAGLTALQALRDLGQIRAGSHVLIVGASGGVGHFAVQIAKTYGAVVTAVCSTDHIELVRRLGADHVIDYTKKANFRNPAPYDLVLDLVVRAPLRVFFPLMATTGVYVSSLPSLSRLAAAVALPWYSQRRVKIARVQPRRADLEVLREMCEAGKLRPVIDRMFPLDALAHAHAYSQKGRTAGKIVVTVAE